MEDKISFTLHKKIIQEDWEESPCSTCFPSACCSYLPLTFMQLETRTDFLNLALLSCYHHIRLGLKKSGEWTVYFQRDCRFLDTVTSKCRIHGIENQSFICKSYDAHKCWYRPAFQSHQNEELILFDLDRLLLLEKETDFLKTGYIKNSLNWDEIIMRISRLPLETRAAKNDEKTGFPDNVLAFKRNYPERFLFFPPFEKPKRDAHFDLFRFRLGFPGISLAVADNCWATMVHTRINKYLFRRFALKYFPSLKAEHGCFSFFQLNKDKWFYSEIGEKWVIVQLEHIESLKRITRFDSSDNIERLPTTREIFALILSEKPEKPDRAA
ncbi:MAG: hypothetical protein JXB88_25840 [Spirochaetales bacterium]|nr:hypothetical protein [Spirochaetales bacterium]